MKKLLLTLTATLAVATSYSQNTFPASGNVGIGTTAPGTNLDVHGLIRSSSGGLQIGKFGIASNPILSIGLDRSDFSNSAIINGWGNSSNPGISVGTTRYDGIAFSVVTGVALDGYFLPLSPGTTAFTVLGNSNVGIGTKTPNAPLEINQSSDQAVPLRLYGGSTSNVANKSNMLAFMISDTQGGEKAAAGIQSISNNYDVNGAHLSFLTSNGNIYDPNALTERMRIDPLGNVAIGTTNSRGYKLAINGSTVAESMTVKLYGNWPDYVFKSKYKLPTLNEVKNYIDQCQRLPDMPSAEEVIKDGINLGEMNKLLLKKVEELTLYMIEMQDQLKLQNEKIRKLERDNTQAKN